jgi:TRAP-type mannitol/chloroaromatic compound transport system substrate-binding protein
MHQWLNARCAKLLEDLNNTPFTDDVDEIKLNLIRAAMREASIEMFQRAAEQSRTAIKRINTESLSEAISQVESSLMNDVMKETESLLADAETESSPLNQTDSSPASEATATEPPQPAKENKPKIQISSSVIRRAD